ncbi:hypothetical protein HYDPIDRAFT_44792, partial [Hydnomerulius pinastri MD-312]
MGPRCLGTQAREIPLEDICERGSSTDKEGILRSALTLLVSHNPTLSSIERGLRERIEGRTNELVYVTFLIPAAHLEVRRGFPSFLGQLDGMLRPATSTLRDLQTP